MRANKKKFLASQKKSKKPGKKKLKNVDQKQSIQSEESKNLAKKAHYEISEIKYVEFENDTSSLYPLNGYTENPRFTFLAVKLKQLLFKQDDLRYSIFYKVLHASETIQQTVEILKSGGCKATLVDLEYACQKLDCIPNAVVQDLIQCLRNPHFFDQDHKIIEAVLLEAATVAELPHFFSYLLQHGVNPNGLSLHWILENIKNSATKQIMIPALLRVGYIQEDINTLLNYLPHATDTVEEKKEEKKEEKRDEAKTWADKVKKWIRIGRPNEEKVHIEENVQEGAGPFKKRIDETANQAGAATYFNLIEAVYQAWNEILRAQKPLSENQRKFMQATVWRFMWRVFPKTISLKDLSDFHYQLKPLLPLEEKWLIDAYKKVLQHRHALAWTEMLRTTNLINDDIVITEVKESVDVKIMQEDKLEEPEFSLIDPTYASPLSLGRDMILGDRSLIEYALGIFHLPLLNVLITPETRNAFTRAPGAETDKQGLETPLQFAIKCGQKQSVKFLLQQGAIPSPSLHFSSRQQEIELWCDYLATIVALIDGQRLQLPKHKGDQVVPFHDKVASSNPLIVLVKYYHQLVSYLSPEAKLYLRDTFFHLYLNNDIPGEVRFFDACFKDNKDIFRLVDAKTYWTDRLTVNGLLEEGALIVKIEQQVTALALAAFLNKEECVAYCMRQYKISAFLPQSEQPTLFSNEDSLLAIAMQGGAIDVIKFLIAQHGAFINHAHRTTGWSAFDFLDFIPIRHRQEILSLFLTNGVEDFSLVHLLEFSQHEKSFEEFKNVQLNQYILTGIVSVGSFSALDEALQTRQLAEPICRVLQINLPCESMELLPAAAFLGYGALVQFILEKLTKISKQVKKLLPEDIRKEAGDDHFYQDYRHRLVVFYFACLGNHVEIVQLLLPWVFECAQQKRFHQTFEKLLQDNVVYTQTIKRGLAKPLFNNQLSAQEMHVISNHACIRSKLFYYFNNIDTKEENDDQSFKLMQQRKLRTSVEKILAEKKQHRWSLFSTPLLNTEHDTQLDTFLRKCSGKELEIMYKDVYNLENSRE